MCSCVSSDSGLNTSVKCYYTTFSCHLSTPILSNFQNPSRDTHYAFTEHGDGDDCSRDATAVPLSLRMRYNDPGSRMPCHLSSHLLLLSGRSA